MASPSRRRYLLIPVLYVLVILGLFGLALFGRGFSHAVGEARLTGRYAALPLFGSREVRKITISYHGLSLGFSRRVPLVLGAGEAGRDSGEARGLRAIEVSTAGADIIFEQDTRLRLSPLPDGSITLSADIPAPSSPEIGDAAALLLVPYRLRGTAARSEAAPVLSWSQRSASFLLTLPAGSRIDEATGTIVLAMKGAAAGSPLRLAHGAGSSQSPLASWLSEEASRVSSDDLRLALSRFTDAAYIGWSGVRLSAESFDERLASSLLCESLARGTYLRLRPVVAEALAQRLRIDPAREMAFSASAYVGNLREYTRRLTAGEGAELERIRALLARSDVLLLDTPRLIPLLLDHGPFALVPEVFAFAGSRDPRPLGPDTALGLLEALLDYSALVERTDEAPRMCRNVIESRLLPSVSRTDKGVFLVGREAGIIDVARSVRCGALFLRAGTEMDMPLIGAIGRSLLVSSIGMATDSAILPARLTLAADRIASRDGSLAPEQIYGELPLDGPLAREVPLYGSLGPGAWILTAARPASVENTPKTATISLTFPVGMPHYAVIQGIAPFSQLELHGIPWRPAPDYAQYSDGWTYDGQNRTLYLKLTGRVDREEIRITY